MSFHTNQTLVTQTIVNLRRTPGHLGKPGGDVITALAQGAAAVVTGAAQDVDGLTWWPVRVTLPDGAALEGWVAQAVGDIPLMAAQNPTTPVPAPQPPPVAPPVIEPVTEPPGEPPPTAANKLGFYLHVSTDQHGLWDAVTRVQPPVMLIHADTANKMLLEEMRRWRSPNTFVVGRMYKDQATQQAILDHPDPEGQGRMLADEIIHYDFGFAFKRGENGRLLVDAWMTLNECAPGPASSTFQEEQPLMLRRYDHYDRIQAAFQQRMQEVGLEGVAFNFAAGNFTQASHYLDYFPRTLAAFVYLGFHEYGWPALNPNQGAPTSAGIYRRVMDGVRANYGDRHRVIMTEAGLTRAYGQPQNPDRGWLDPAETLSEDFYWEQSLAWYNRLMAQDDYVLGACLYEVGHHGDWATFRHLGEDNQGNALHIIDRIVALKDTSRAGLRAAQLAQATPPRITIGGTVYRDQRAAPDATVRIFGGQETIGSQRGATLAAPSSVTWSRRVTGFAGDLRRAWNRFVADGVAGITWAEFKAKAPLYNPQLATTAGRFVREQTYLLPENRFAALEVAWDRTLTGYAGTVRACWLDHVQGKVIGLTYATFKRALHQHNPTLAADGGRFLLTKRYVLPRTVGVQEYVLTAITGVRGRFRFTGLPAGEYRIEVTAPGCAAFTTGLSAGADTELTVALQPLRFTRPTAGAGGLTAGTFVRVAGDEFVEGGQRLRFIGVNIRGLVHYGDGRTLEHTNDGHRGEQLRAARDMGARVVRVFLPCVNANIDQTIAGLQRVLEIMRAETPNLYLLPALSNLYADVPFRVQGDDGFYARVNPNFHTDLLNSAFFTGGYRVNYLNLVRRVVESFRGEPRIFAWEIGNELKLDTTGAPPASDPHVAAFIAFNHAVAAEIRRLDPNHLITTGMSSTHHAWLHTPELRRRLYATPLFGFITVHCYNDELENDDSALAAELRKPFIVEEAGYGRRYLQDRFGERPELTRHDLARWFNLGARGYMPWGFMATGNDIGDGDDDAGFDRALHGDWDVLFSIFRDKAHELAQVDPNWRPPIVERPTPIDPTPVGGAFQPGQQVVAQTAVRVRRAPGAAKPEDDTFKVLAPGEAATVTGGPEPRDGLTWWRVRVAVADGSTQEGWAAESVNGQPLLASVAPALSRGLRRIVAAG
jgi:hypothetical protein